jgi:hypothetical protein
LGAIFFFPRFEARLDRGFCGIRPESASSVEGSQFSFVAAHTLELVVITESSSNADAISNPGGLMAGFLLLGQPFSDDRRRLLSCEAAGVPSLLAQRCDWSLFHTDDVMMSANPIGHRRRCESALTAPLISYDV